MEKIGVYWLLNACPIPALAIGLIFACIGVLFVIRDIFEKLPYNVSVASQQGGCALIYCVLVAADIVGRSSDLQFHQWNLLTNDHNIQVLWFVLCIAIGMAGDNLAIHTTKKYGRIETIADTYHNLCVVPLLVFLMGISFPVIFTGGTKSEIYSACGAIALWVLTFCFDFFTGRLKQPIWWAQRGIFLPLKPARKPGS